MSSCRLRVCPASYILLRAMFSPKPQVAGQADIGIGSTDSDRSASKRATGVPARERAHLGVAHNYVSHINVGRQAEHWGRPPGLERHTDDAVLSLHLQAHGVADTRGFADNRCRTSS